jgi:hypothetical protein
MTGLFVQVLAGVVLASSFGSVPSADKEQHCVVEVVGESKSGELITTEPVCFSTFSDAMRSASGGELILPRNVDGDIVLSSGDIAQAVSSFAIGVHYDGYNGSGSSITITGSNCSGGYWNATGFWKDRIRSSYNGCPKLRHYTNKNRQGSSQTTSPAGQTHNLGSTLAGRVESVQYSS